MNNQRTYNSLLIVTLPMLVVAGMVTAAAAFLAANPSSKYIKFVSWEYDEVSGNVTFTRRLPNGPVWAQYIHEVYTEDGLSCPDTGATFYEIAPKDTVRFPLPKNLKPCYDQGNVTRSILQWRVMKWGIRLPPVVIEVNHQPSDVNYLQRK